MKEELFQEVTNSIAQTMSFINETQDRSITENQLVELSDEQLIMTIVIKSDRYGDTNEEKFTAMNNSEKVAYTVAWFNWEVQNGGLCQYFSNRGDTAPYLCEALKSIGAKQIEAKFSEFVSKYHIDVTDLHQFVADTSEEYDEKTKLLPFDEFDNAYMGEDVEDLESLNAKFIREHIADFVKLMN